MEIRNFEVVVIGGSYAGLSTALSLGRAKRRVLVLDAGKPCNQQTPHAHNFLTHDGRKPGEIAALARKEILNYPTVTLQTDIVRLVEQKERGFKIATSTGVYSSRKLVIATGLKDIHPNISGFSSCWGISVIHCPYCHGYEVSNEKIGLMMNGEQAYEMAKNLNHWNEDLTILTNGKSDFTTSQINKLRTKSIKIIEYEIEEFKNTNGILEKVKFKNGKSIPFKAVYARCEVSPNIDFGAKLAIELSALNTIKVNEFQQTNLTGIYAAGDCTTLMRSLSVAVAAGTMAAVMVNKELIEEDF